jgi:hypothetical protein
MRIPLPFIVLCVVPALAACDGGGTGASAPGGEFIAALESPNGAEGAALLELTGEGIESVTAASLSLFQLPITGGRRVMLVREPAGRIEFRVRVAPGSEPPAARVLQVVDGNDEPRASADGYAVTYTPTRGTD